MLRRSIFALAALGGVAAPSAASTPSLDLWGPEVLAKIRDRSTLNERVVVHGGYFEVYYDSELGDAKWADSSPPYAVHTGGTIRIHGYLATPLVGGPYPAIVIGHGHRGRGSRDLAIALAALGYVALSIDGPGQGGSTGPPDSEQGWISVEETINQPSPEVGYLYHYAYAGMRGLTLLDRLSRLPFNPLRIDRNRLGVIGASMGGQFTYYVNGVDDRVKGAVAIAVAGDWEELLRYEGGWLYHGLYYYTRNGLESGDDYLNTISNVCLDPTFRTFLDYFDPIRYAPRQHAPLLTILGTHDQYFTLPAVNTTYDRVASAGTSSRFQKRLMLTPNGKHEVVNEDDLLPTLLPVLANIDRWFRYSFHGGAAPPATPAVSVDSDGERLWFKVTAPRGTAAVRTVRLHYATQVDTLPDAPCDFASRRLKGAGEEWWTAVPIGTLPPCGPPVTPQNVLYYATVQDDAGYSISSKLYYQGGEMPFGTDFVPLIEHFPRDDFDVPPPPLPCIQ
jgi:cephalosporin-C deacetylase-like acetyl esterase